MGKYDGILIMSDWDGTLSHGGAVPEENQKAIRRFQSEGGKFTFCSGRNYTHFDQYRDMVVPNAPICAYNGALVVDTDGKVLCESFLEISALRLAEPLIKSDLFAKFVIYTKENGEPAIVDPADFLSRFDEYAKMHHYKMVFVAKSEEDALRGKALAESLMPSGYFAARSWPVGLEILKKSASKGEALRFLKAHLGARLTVAAGDFENDAEMLIAADVGYAVDNAVPSVKEAADRITVAAKDSAIAKIIEDLGSE